MTTSTRLGSLLLASAVLITVAGCGGSAASQDSEQVSISFLSYNFGTADLGGQGTQELIDQFQAAHPTITIKPEAAAAKDVLTKARTATAAGNAPDVAQLGWSKMAEAYSSLPVVPVQTIPSESEWREHVAGMSGAVLEATKHQGKVAAMPYTMSTPTLFYNADLFRKAGLDPETPPASVEDVKRAGLAIKASGAQGVYYGVADPSKSDFLTQSLVSSNGGSLVSASGEITLDQPPAVAALAAMGDLTASGAQPAVRLDDALAAFKAGSLGMFVSSTALLAALDKAAGGKFDLRTAPMPGFGGRPARPTYSGAGLVVLSKDAAKRKAAWEFVKFLTGDRGFTTVTEKIGYLPLRPALVEDPKHLAGYFAKDRRLLPSLRQLDSVVAYTAFPGKQASKAVVMLQDEAVEPIVLRGADPKSTLAAVAAKIRQLADQ